jgi:hypothetical protein
MSYLSMHARIGESLGSVEDYMAARKRGVTDAKILAMAGLVRSDADEDDTPDRDDGQDPEPTEKKKTKKGKTVKKKSTKKTATASAPVDFARLERDVARLSASADEGEELDTFEPTPAEAGEYVRTATDRMLAPSAERQQLAIAQSFGFSSVEALHAAHTASKEAKNIVGSDGRIYQPLPCGLGSRRVA